jgi:hypothetical protein
MFFEEVLEDFLGLSRWRSGRFHEHSSVLLLGLFLNLCLDERGFFGLLLKSRFRG